MGFIDSYKELEKICGDLLNDERRVSAYIDEMINTPRGSYYVVDWNEDLKKLKHYRWIRNKIVHDPDCNEQNMCTPEDKLWIDTFRSRIINQTDPLSLYEKTIYSHHITTKINTTNTKQKKNEQKKRFILLKITIFLFVFLLFYYIFKNI